MIVESSAQATLSYSQMHEKDKVASPTDSPPAYSDVSSDWRQSGPSLHRPRGERRSRRGPPQRNQSLPPPPLPIRRSPPNHGIQASPGAHSFAHGSPSPSVDQVHICDRKHNIEGTYYIDPMVPMLDPSRRQKPNSNEPPLHASFRTRHNTIDLKLGTTGDVRRTGKANVAVASRDGFIKVTLLPTLPSTPRMGLNVSSRQGTVAVFIPDDFVGMVQLASRKGALQVLPTLASHMKTIKTSEHEIIFIIGNANDDSDGSREASFCDLSTRTGDIVVGFSGRDHYVAPVGFWQKLGGILKGNTT